MCTNYGSKETKARIKGMESWLFWRKVSNTASRGTFMVNYGSGSNIERERVRRCGKVVIWG